jgi:hypothetical protein
VDPQAPGGLKRFHPFYVNVGEIQRDRQGTHYFEMRDLEGNLIEISQQP